jgi:hypothetical protein
MESNERLRELERQAEAYYAAMYETRSPSGDYANAKDAFCEAIALARRLGDDRMANRLEARLEHVKAVFRSQFT